MKNDYVDLKTIDNTRVRIRKDNIGAIEEISGTVRSEGYVKVYVAGFAFNIRGTFEEITRAVHGAE